MLGVKLFNFSPGFQIYHWNLNTYILEKKFIKSIRNKAGPQTENVENQKVNTDFFIRICKEWANSWQFWKKTGK